MALIMQYPYNHHPISDYTNSIGTNMFYPACVQLDFSSTHPVPPAHLLLSSRPCRASLPSGVWSGTQRATFTCVSLMESRSFEPDTPRAQMTQTEHKTCLWVSLVLTVYNYFLKLSFTPCVCALSLDSCKEIHQMFGLIHFSYI